MVAFAVVILSGCGTLESLTTLLLVSRGLLVGPRFTFKGNSCFSPDHKVRLLHLGLGLKRGSQSSIEIICQLLLIFVGFKGALVI